MPLLLRQTMIPFLMVAALVLLVGCANDEGSKKQTAEQKNLSGPLLGKRWTLLLVGTSERLSFETTPWFEISPNGDVSGFDGCNPIMTSVTLGKNHHIEFGDIASGRMACPGMENARQVTEMLNSAYGYLIDHDRLVFFGPDQRVLGGWRESN
ncbi:META domain-containing protein [Halomonas halocynthiae]|uniref:META domain-containing protein n=1 Tax=Halomonas halocynthiae TaxID=176290 RepID=UPI0003FDB3A8|nr:META domain-containing protein [Halomonas halocynthiae]